MKSGAVAVASLLALLAPGIAGACEPETTCGDQYCWGSSAVIEAQLLGTPPPNAYTVDLHIIATYGDTRGLPAGSDVTIASDFWFEDGDSGRTLPLTITHDADGNPRVSQKIDTTNVFTAHCFGGEAPTADIAAILLSPDCYHTLTPVEPPPPHCPTGVGISCSTGDARTGLPVVLVLGAVMFRRRRR